MRRAIVSAPIVAAIAVVLALSGCTGGASPTSPPSPSVSSSSAPATRTPAPDVPLVVTPETPADVARNIFDAVNGHTLSNNPRALGPDFVAALEAAGFPREQLEVTADTTSVGLEAGSIQFAVRWGDSCFIGQNGAGSAGYHSETVPVLATGKCLVGDTRPIG